MPRGKSQRDWTILVYLAADNDLSAQALEDLEGMKRGLRSSRIAVVAELDPRPRGAPSKRFILTRAGKLAADAVAELGETNSGDARTL